LKKLFNGPSRNFWYGVEEDKYLGASALGSDMVTKKNFCREAGVLNTKVSMYLALVGM
jgi:hypothetical protein